MENPKFEERFNVLPLVWRHQYVESLYEPFKVKGERDEIFKDYPKLKDSNGNDSSKLNVSYDSEYHNGQLMRWANDSGGFYAIFYPKKDEFEKQKVFARNEKIREDLSRLAHLQDRYVMKGNNFEDLEKIEAEITSLFNSIFDCNNTIRGVQKPNAHPRIFVSDFAYNLFEEFRLKIKKEHAEYSFIYRIMYSEKLIFQGVGDSEYREWLSDSYGVSIDKTKRLDDCKTNERFENYRLLKTMIAN